VNNMTLTRDSLVRAGVLCAPIHDVPTALADPHMKHRGMVVEIGEYRGVELLVKLSRTPAKDRAEPPPREPAPRNP
jgi:crotonobetainyl-CoA:carnitine CoA-transferase CaiB-like acyl-CoA transferase